MCSTGSSTRHCGSPGWRTGREVASQSSVSEAAEVKEDSSTKHLSRPGPLLGHDGDSERCQTLPSRSPHLPRESNIGIDDPSL